MSKLEELLELEREVERRWFDCLLRVDEMLSMHADDPERGCLRALREAQDDVLVLGQWRLQLQKRIAALEGPQGELTRRPCPGWPQAGAQA
jgi:hypothetical protein